MRPADHSIIIGAGFSGTLMAINLLRHGAPKVTLIEQVPERLGRGLAYGAAHSEHLLNVRAANMSAFPDDPAHFAQWLRARDGGKAAGFASRRTYGAYLTEMLDAAGAAAGDRLAIVEDEVVTVTARSGRVELAAGRVLQGDAVILAPGNLPPPTPGMLAPLRPPVYLSDPWAQPIGDGLENSDTVLLIGSGLTAVDCVLTLDQAGFRGRIVALSRRGLAPHVHDDTPAPPRLPQRPRERGSHLVTKVRARAREIGWRGAVDELRPYTQDIWRDASQAERARMLRHLRPYWDVHRHRIAPDVAARLEQMRQEGRLSVRAGRISHAEQHQDEAEILWRPRGGDASVALTTRRIVNCTGPLGDLQKTRSQLLACLLDRGEIRPDALGIGIDVDRMGRALRSDGKANAALFVVGPMTRGAHWEIVAVPDIRRQVWDLARQLTGSHWVEASGL